MKKSVLIALFLILLIIPIAYAVSFNGILNDFFSKLSDKATDNTRILESSSNQCSLFSEDFNNVDKWDFSDVAGIPVKLGNEWSIVDESGDKVLKGTGHNWANAGDEKWTNYIFKTNIKLVQGAVHVNVRKGYDGRYFLGVSENRLYLNKQFNQWSEFADLKSVEESVALDQWHTLVVEAKGNNIKVYLDDALKIDHTDTNPLTSGSIAFETLDDSIVYFDDVRVDGDCIGEAPILECTDTDGGKDYYTNGFIQVPGVVYNDACGADGKHLMENFCLNGERQVEEFECPGACQNGACVEQSKEFLLYQEDFSSPDNFEELQWYADPYEYSTLSYNKSGGFVRLMNITQCYFKRGNVCELVPGIFALNPAHYIESDFAFESKIRLSEGRFNIVFAIREEAFETGWGLWDYHLEIDGNGIKLVKTHQDSRTNINERVELGVSPLQIDTKWYTIRVSKAGNNIKVSVDGIKKIEVTDQDPYQVKGTIKFKTDSGLIDLDDWKVFSLDHKKYDHMIDIDTNSISGNFENIYACGAVFYDETYPMFSSTDPIAAKLKDIGIRYIRIRAIGDEGWKGRGVKILQEGQSFTLDFTQFDEIVKTLKDSGIEPIMRLGWSLPAFIVDERCRNGKTGNQDVSGCPPADYSQWEEVVYQIVKHYNVDNDYNITYWAVWNEPDLAEYGGSDAEISLRNKDNYIKLYSHAAQGALRADPKVKIGGPTIAQSCGNGWVFDFSCLLPDDEGGIMEGLLDYCSKNNIPLDFLDYHRYDNHGGREANPKSFAYITQFYKNLTKSYSLSPEIMQTESSFVGLKNELSAAYMASLMHHQMDGGIDLICYTSLTDLIMGEGEDYYGSCEEKSLGYASYPITINNEYKTTNFKVFEMLAELSKGKNKLKVSIDGDDDISSEHSVGSLATRAEDGTIRIFIWRYEDWRNIDKNINLSITNLQSQVTVDTYLIDKTHNNPYIKCLENPEAFGPNIEEPLEKLSSQTINVKNGKIDLPLDLEDYSIMLIVIKTKETQCNSNSICDPGETKENCPSDCQITQECTQGCLYESKCIPYGTRINNNYCDLSGQMLNQKSEGQSCENNFECSANICITNKCISENLWNRFLKWFGRFFNR